MKKIIDYIDDVKASFEAGAYDLSDLFDIIIGFIKVIIDNETDFGGIL